MKLTGSDTGLDTRTHTQAETKLGTTEREWLASRCLQRLREQTWPSTDVERGKRRVVVIAPHPDDETLGVGGTLFMLARAGYAIDVVGITDGEASHPHSRTVTPAQLAGRRAAERWQAFASLGLADVALFRMGLDHGTVSRSVGLVSRLTELVVGASLCLSPYRGDGHPDHEAVGLAAARACEAACTPLAEYPIWAWHWARPDQDDLPWRRARRVSLTEPARTAKCRAIDAYRSQREPLSPEAGDEAVLPNTMVERFQRNFEVLFV